MNKNHNIELFDVYGRDCTRWLGLNKWKDTCSNWQMDWFSVLLQFNVWIWTTYELVKQIDPKKATEKACIAMVGFEQMDKEP